MPGVVQAEDSSPPSHLPSPRVQSLKAESPGRGASSPRSPLSPRSPSVYRKSSENDSPLNFASENGEEVASAADEPAAIEKDALLPVAIEVALPKNGPASEDGLMQQQHGLIPEVPNGNNEEEDLKADESEAAFCAEAAAFARKDQTHERALQSLVDDMVANEREAGEAGAEAAEEEEEGMDAHAATEALKDEAPKDAAMEIVAESSKDGAKSSSSMQASSSSSSSAKKTSSSPRAATPKPNVLPSAAAGEGKRQESKRHSPAQEARSKPVAPKPDHQSSPPEGKRRIHPIRDREKLSQEKPPPIVSPRRSPASKASPLSPLRPLKITPPSFPDKMPSPSLRTPPKLSKFSPKFAAAASSKKTEDKGAREKPGNDIASKAPETDNVQRRVKEFFQRRKSAIAFGSSRKAAAGLAAADSESILSSEHNTHLSSRESPDLGPFLLKLAKQAIASGDTPQKALDYAARAAKSFENAADGKPSLDLVMSLHVLAAIHCSLGEYEEAIPVLEQSVSVLDVEAGGQEHALAAFAGHMQLGDTFSLLGKGEDALSAYHAGLEVQKRALGEKDSRVGETCRYLAEAHAQAMQFDQAEELCQHALDIHKEHSAPASIEEATDRRLMGLICNGKGQHEAALEHLVLASMALIANSKDLEVAAVDTSIGDTYVSLGRCDEAVFAYQKALTVFKASKGENHVSVASIYVSLAELYLKTGKLRETRAYCESALRIYSKQGGGPQVDEVASGLTEIAVVYEALNEQQQALSLLQKALSILESAPGQQSAAAGVEAQIGVLNYMCGKYAEAHNYFSKAVSKLRISAEKSSSLLGIVLNQMGLACVHLSEIAAASEVFEESRRILEAACGPHHPDTLAVCSNLAGAYDALGRLDDAINILQFVVEVREEKLGTANPEVDNERSRLAELLKEAGRFRARRLNNTLELLMQSNSKPAVMSLASQDATGDRFPVKGQKSLEVKVAAQG